jgi:O-antigen/teichoic acid export membrane protein
VSWLNLVVATVKGILTLVFLFYVSPTVESFLIANILAGLIHSFAAAFCLRRYSREKVLSPRFDFLKFWMIARKSLQLSALGILGILFVHVDKMILSRFCDFSLFGVYTVCWIVVYGMYGFCSSLPAFFGPRFTYLHALHEREKLVAAYHLGCQWMSVLGFSGALLFLFFSRQILFLWMGDPVLVENASMLTSLLIAGSCLHVLTFIPQAFQVAHRWTSLTLRLQACGIVAWVGLLILAVRFFGILGAGLAWIVLHFVYLMIYSTLMHRRLLTTEKAAWLYGDILRPFVGAFSVCALCWLIFSHLIHGFLGAILLCCIAVATFLVSALMAPSIRPAVIHFVRRKVSQVDPG